MRKFIITALPVLGILAAPAAMAGVVTDSAGNPVESYAAQKPVTSGPFAIESEQGYHEISVPGERTVTVEREICKRASFFGGLVKGLHKKGFKYAGHHKWTKTVTEEQTQKYTRVIKRGGDGPQAGGKDSSDGGAGGRGDRGADASR